MEYLKSIQRTIIEEPKKAVLYGAIALGGAFVAYNVYKEATSQFIGDADEEDAIASRMIEGQSESMVVPDLSPSDQRVLAEKFAKAALWVARDKQVHCHMLHSFLTCVIFMENFVIFALCVITYCLDIYHDLVVLSFSHLPLLSPLSAALSIRFKSQQMSN